LGFAGACAGRLVGTPGGALDCGAICTGGKTSLSIGWAIAGKAVKSIKADKRAKRFIFMILYERQFASIFRHKKTPIRRHRRFYIWGWFSQECFHKTTPQLRGTVVLSFESF
jgi:hypothetical protein